MASTKKLYKRGILFFTLLISCLSILGCQEFVEGYRIEDQKVYYKQLSSLLGTTTTVIDSADYKSFRALRDGRYGVDKNYVFLFGNILKGADPNSFELVKGSSYLKMYAKDKSYVYLENTKIEGANPKHFKLLNGNYSTDENSIFYDESRFASISKYFEIIDDYYSKDNEDVYLMGAPLKVCSVKDFDFVFKGKVKNDDVFIESESERWAKDGCHYYYGTIKVPSEDYDNIKIIKGSMGVTKDSKNVFWKDRNIKYNFEGKKILDTIDIATFTCDGRLKCKDKFGPINMFCGRTECDEN